MAADFFCLFTVPHVYTKGSYLIAAITKFAFSPAKNRNFDPFLITMKYSNYMSVILS